MTESKDIKEEVSAVDEKQGVGPVAEEMQDEEKKNDLDQPLDEKTEPDTTPADQDVSETRNPPIAPTIKIDSAPPTPHSSSITNEPLPLQTPAPGAGYNRSSSPLVPDAPAPKPVPRELPTSTPANSTTPMPSGQGRGMMDISEFDPLATPSAPVEGGGGEETPVPGPSNPNPNPMVARAPATPSRVTGGATSTSTPEASTEIEGTTFNFSGFLKDLRTKGAEPIAKYLKR
jgi:hypothetical protein